MPNMTCRKDLIVFVLCSLATPGKLDQGRQEALRVRAVFLFEEGRDAHGRRRWLSGFHRGRSALVWGIPAHGRPGIGKESAVRRAGDHAYLTELKRGAFQRGSAIRCRTRWPLPFALWTEQAVRELIHKKLGKTLGPVGTMQLLFERWGSLRESH